MKKNKELSPEEEAALAEKCIRLALDSLKKDLSGRELNLAILNLFIGCLAITMATVFPKENYEEGMKDVGIQIKAYLDRAKEIK